MPPRPPADAYPLQKLSHRSSLNSNSMPRLDNGNGEDSASAQRTRAGILRSKKGKERLSDAEVEDEEDGEGAALLGGQNGLDPLGGDMVSFQTA